MPELAKNNHRILNKGEKMLNSEKLLEQITELRKRVEELEKEKNNMSVR